MKRISLFIVLVLLPVGVLYAQRFSGWVPFWVKERSGVRNVQGKNLDTVWTGSLTVPIKNGVYDFANVMYQPNQAMQLLCSTAQRCGPFLQNLIPGKGFDKELGRQMITMPREQMPQRCTKDGACSYWRSDWPLVKRLGQLAQQYKWTAFNIDLESLDDDLAQSFSQFVSALQQHFKELGLTVRVSVALHPYEAPFQNWELLRKLTDVDMVLMGYDRYTCGTQAGLVAPYDWLAERAAKGKRSFGDRFMVGLPSYGYHWKSNSCTSFRANEQDATLLAQSGWKLVSSAIENGLMYRKGNEVIAYDNATTLRAKIKKLTALGITRFALWHLGATTLDMFQ